MSDKLERKTFHIKTGDSAVDVTGTCIHRHPDGGVQVRDGKKTVAVVLACGAMVVAKEPERC